MSRLIKFLGIPVFAVALLAAADTSSANAAGFSVRVGGIGISHGYYYGVRPTVLPVRTVQPIVRYPSYYRGHFGYFHNTTHLDYHAPRLVPHNGHLDYVPGHYDVHHTGHWHH